MYFDREIACLYGICKIWYRFRKFYPKYWNAIIFSPSNLLKNTILSGVIPFLSQPL